MRWLFVLLLVAPVAAQDTIEPIDIRDDQSWYPAGPARSGSGTPGDPYIVSDYIIQRSPLSLTADGPAIHVQDTSAHVVFRNIQIVQEFDIGVDLHSVENLVFQDLEVRNAGRGMHVQGASDVALLDSAFYDTGPDDFAAGLLVLDSTGVLVRQTSFEDGDAPGIRVSTSDKIQIEGVAVRRHDGGLRVHSSGDVNLLGIAVEDNRGDGAWVSNVTRLQLVDVRTTGSIGVGGVNSGRGIVIWETNADIQGLITSGNDAAGAAVLNGRADIRVSRFLDNQGPGLTVASGDVRVQAIEAHGNKGPGVSVVPPSDGRAAARLVSLQLHDNRGPGLFVEGMAGVHIEGVRSQHNEGAGIDVRSSGNLTILDTRALDNTQAGVYVADSTTGQIFRSRANDNLGDGFVVIRGGDIRVLNNTASGNQGSGFVVEGPHELVDNVATENGGFGVHVVAGSPLLQGNELNGNVRGDELEQRKESPIPWFLPLAAALVGLLRLRHQRT